MANDAAPPVSRKTSRDGIVRWWDLLLIFVLGVALAIFVTILAFAADFWIEEAHGAHILDPFGYAEILASNFFFATTVIGLSDLSWLGLLWLILKRRFSAPFAHYFPRVPVRLIVLAAFSGLATTAILNGANLFLSRYQIVTFQKSTIERAIVPHDMRHYLVTLAVAGLLAPFLEELLFRGVLLDWLRRKIGYAGGLATSSIIFGFFHGRFLRPGIHGWLVTAELCVAGVVFGLWMLRTGSLRTSFAAHAAFNAATMLVPVLW